MFVADPIPEIVMEPSLTQPLTSFAASDVPTAPSASDQPGVTLETPTATQATATVAAEDFPPTFPGPTPESQGASTTPDTRFVPVPLKPPKAVPPVASGPYITPLVRKLAKESGVDLDTIQGTGVGGRIRKKDVEAAARELPPRTDKDTADDGVLSTDKGEETKDFVEEISEQEETTESTQESAPKETAEAAETKEDLSAQEETVVVEDTMKPEKVEDTAEDTKKPEKSKETTDTVVDTSDQTQSDQSAEPESAAEETAQPTKDADDVPDMIDDGIAPVSRPDTPEEVEQGETPDDSTTPSAEPTEPIPTQPDQPDKPAAEPDQTTQVVPETDSVPDAAQPAKADQTSESGDLVEPVDLTDPQVFPPPSAVALATTSGRIEPLTPSRTASVASGPVQLTSVVEADVTAIARLRTSASAAFLARHGFELTYIPFVAKAILEALRLFPMFNATIDSNAGTVTYASAEHLTLPMSTPQGLAFPVIRDAGDLSVAGLASRIHDLATRASAGQIAENDLVGGTFSLVDHSRSGTLMDTPVIITPQVGIASVGSVVKRPVVVDDPRLGEIVAVRDMVYLSLSYDHRVIGTSDAAQFLGTIKTRLEVGDFGAEF
jgi:2-oxoglutarate dehydrogenase E2 component (dihydrolipoamide succinyltransferase)